ncbi:cell surface protein [uncultured Brachyspira sp.]|uniref:cell surface protein n=1 Tax=uncultured Brachyspira sp. TaxID=221953 RepID=UPI0025CCB868|nr:cell surface protein [uncultured Brachyspira sp.]
MKKVLLTAMALLTIASTSVFGMYGADSDWIDFLVHGNQLRARMDRLGFVLGNDMIRGTFGLTSEGTTLGAIMDTKVADSKQFFNFLPTVSAGIGYTSEVFSIGVGYNYAYRHSKLQNIDKKGYGLSVHTPVITMTAMNDSLRIAIPVQIAAKNGDKANISDKEKYMGISMDPQIRYYTGIEAFNEIRLYIKYGMNELTRQVGTKQTGSSFGFDFRAYFGATVGDVALKPFLKVTYDTALDAKGKYGDGSYSVKSDSYVFNNEPMIGYTAYDSNPWQLKVLPTLGMSANSDIVSIYVEAGLGYKATDTGYKLNAGNNGVKHELAWSSYGEVYITPVKDLEWYFEAEIGNYNLDNIGTGSIGDLNVQFNASTGITWYLPAL